MARNEKLAELLEPTVQSLGYELVCVELIRAKTTVLRLYIDGPNGIGIEDCETVSRQVSGVMDVEDPISGEYNLEVSSPGLDRPLAKLAHFQQFLGEEAQVMAAFPVDGRRKFTGRITSIEGDDITLTDKTEQVWIVNFAQIDRAKLIPNFDKKIENLT